MREKWTMESQRRTSPLTALFCGLFFMGAVIVAGATTVVLYGMRIVDKKTNTVLGLVQDGVGNLPAIIQSLPPAVEQALGDQRAPEYAKNLEIRAELVPTSRSGGVAPVLTIKNAGGDVVSLLAVRVAALDARGIPQAEWTEVVATPLAFDDDWRGPILPHSTRHVVLSRWRAQSPEPPGGWTSVCEISDVRVWQPRERSVRSASVAP